MVILWIFSLASAQEASHGTLAAVACAHCHEDPHQATAASPLPTPACVTCHTADAWSPSTFTVADHAEIVFPLEGRHIETACSACHVKAQLVGLPRTCAECHVDRHRGKLGPECTECHSVDGFTPVDDFDHASRTAFVLSGHHGDLPCTDCHKGARGQAMRLTLEPTCTTCHTESHGTFSVPCETCHVLDDPTFAVAAKGFDHRPTAFPLQRRHRALGCASCHAVGQTEPPAPQCRACHDDPHSGQLGATCGDCHRPDRFSLVRFDHDQTGWALRGRHFVTPCLSCHTAQRFVGLRDTCVDCHAVDAVRGPPSVPAHGIAGSDCSDCHGTWSWRF